MPPDEKLKDTYRWWVDLSIDREGRLKPGDWRELRTRLDELSGIDGCPQSVKTALVIIGDKQARGWGMIEVCLHAAIGATS